MVPLRNVAWVSRRGSPILRRRLLRTTAGERRNPLKLTVDAEYVLSPLQSLVGRSQAWVKRVHLLSDGSAVVHLTSCERYDFQDHLAVLFDGKCRIIHEPASLTRARKECEEDPAREANMLCQSFRLGDRIGLLLSDRWLWLFDPLNDDEAVEIAIDSPLPTWAPASWPDNVAAYDVVRCGVTADHRVPVVLGHPAATHDYTAHLSLLDIDAQKRRAFWSLLDGKGRPVSVRYRPNPNFKGVEGHEGTYLCDLAWLGDRFRVFTIGNQTHVGRQGMSYAAVLETGQRGEKPVLLHELDGGCYGGFDDDFDVLLAPQSKSGRRKGKAALLTLPVAAEEELAPRGYSGFKPFAARAGKIWFAGGGGSGSWASWQQLSLTDGEGKPGCILACTLS